MRVDIEELKNLADEMPEKAKAMNDKLTGTLEEMNASYPYYNPGSKVDLPHKEERANGDLSNRKAARSS